MHQYKKLVCLHLALVVLAFGIGCSEKKSTTENDFAEDIVGEPIIEITESFKSEIFTTKS